MQIITIENKDGKKFLGCSTLRSTLDSSACSPPRPTVRLLNAYEAPAAPAVCAAAPPAGPAAALMADLCGPRLNPSPSVCW